MSVFADIKELAGGMPMNKTWYREQLQYGLEEYTGAFEVADIIFFNYFFRSCFFYSTGCIIVFKRHKSYCHH